ncbi:Mu transposase, C-terminal [Rhodoferax sp. OV413]|uniref:DDE-type integrase/transposase/recombinase n=1 Tax=Rhodoferax sp. OV413 TaxID=1855285 RepID=UPI00088A93F5|nr:DDE-type integrase/transposase/recombinase [Rhodoferax sp. OV413]SDO77208.1 Mu transposase, C-terminal [Rhodoferax sp. OV413]
MARLGVTLEAAGAFNPASNPRLDLFQRFESYHLARGGAVWPAITEFCALWQAGQIQALPKTVEAYPALPAKTLDKWYRSWRMNGVEALLERKPRKDKGSSQLVEDEELHRVFVAALVEMHDPTARQVQRVISNHLGEERTPAITTLKRWLGEYKETNKVALLKLKNPDGWRNKYMPAFGSRSEHITTPNEEWQLDSTIADAQQRVEMAFNLTDGDTGEIRRHALVAVIDVFTRKAKVLVSRTSSSNAVKAVTRTAMLAWGHPERVKTDNGKDYTAVDYDFALKSLSVQHLLCTPFSPDQKPFIERFLGTLLHDLFPMVHGFVGHDVTTRKAIESGRSFAQRFGHDGYDLHMTPEQLQGAINGWLDEYHGRRHSELGCSPNEMAERHSTHVVRVDERALDLFMMPVAGNGLRTVGKRGISMPLHDAVGTAWYRAPELAGVNVMGQQVYCRIDEADVGAMHVFQLDGTYICRAIDHSRLGINRAELAAKTRALESATVKPLVDELRKAKRKGLVAKAVQAIYQEREAEAVDTAPNVTRLAPREVQHSTPAIASVLAGPTNHEAARAEARAALFDETPVVRMDTAKQRYSAWVRLSARANAGEQLSSRDVDWLRSYQDSSEHDAWHALHEGNDPLAEAAG